MATLQKIYAVLPYSNKAPIPNRIVKNREKSGLYFYYSNNPLFYPKLL